jgi:chorismate mutase-like protein
MFKRFFKKQRLLSLFLALPFFAMTLGQIPLQASSNKPTQEVTLQDQNQTQLSALTSLIVERMQLAGDEAVYKWNHALPIDSSEQESNYLLQIANKAKLANLDETLAQDFFAGQIEAAKMINIEHFETWVNNNIHKHEYTPDLSSLEKKLQETDEKLLIAIIDIYSSLPESQKQAFKIAL